jgi:hypothetical protein
VHCGFEKLQGFQSGRPTGFGPPKPRKLITKRIILYLKMLQLDLEVIIPI